ncbi:MAG: hypothetical protein JSR46_10145 [Verrucomicrobia bacterium]|nr:hypothetical protein [Verrucomicrobiota bacterium]
MMITPISSNWYQDATWTNTISPQLTAAQTAYNTAQTNLTNYTPTYNAALAALQAGSSNPTTLQGLINSFNTAQQHYNLLVSNLQTASGNLLSAQTTAQNYIDSQGDADFNTYTSDLQGEINQQLSLSGGVTSNNLDTQLSTANTARETQRTTFFTALTTFNTDETNLTQARTTLQSLQDQLTLATAQVQLDMENGASASVLSTDEGKEQSLQSQVTLQQGTVSQLQTTRNAQLNTLNTALSNYNTAINSMITIIQEGATSADTSATNFINDLQTAQTQASQLTQNTLTTSKNNDAALESAHESAYPTENASTISTIINAQLATFAASEAALEGLSQVSVNTVSEINFPTLPKSGVMSISALMGFLSGAQLLTQHLSRDLQRADETVDDIRLKIWNLQQALIADTTAALQEWAFIIQLADNEYNDQAKKSNSNLSQTIVDDINNVIANTSNINAVINNINQEISDQNSQGVDVTNALNNSNIIATDVMNQSNQAGPNSYNENNLLNSDTPITPPATLTDPPQVPYPSTIPQLPPFVPPSTPIPSSFPVSSSNTVNVEPPQTSQNDIDTLNSIVSQINSALYPIQSQISGPPINYSLIPPYTEQQYVVVRDLSLYLNIDNAGEIAALIAKLVQNFQEDLRSGFLSSQVVAPRGTEEYIEKKIHPSTHNTQSAPSQTYGTGVMLAGNNALASPGTVGSALNQILQSQSLRQSVESLIEKGSLLAGIETLTKIPTKVANYSVLGLFRNDLLNESNEVQTDQISQTKAQIESTTTSAAIQSIVNLAGNTDLLKQVAANQITQLPPNTLSQGDVAQLLSALVFTISTVLLTVAALALSASEGSTSIDQTIASGFAQPNTASFQSLVSDLQALGVTLPQNITPSTPGFEEAFINALLPQLSPQEQAAFIQQINAIFSSNGITLPTTAVGVAPTTPVSTTPVTAPLTTGAPIASTTITAAPTSTAAVSTTTSTTAQVLPVPHTPVTAVPAPPTPITPVVPPSHKPVTPTPVTQAPVGAIPTGAIPLSPTNVASPTTQPTTTTTITSTPVTRGHVGTATVTPTPTTHAPVAPSPVGGVTATPTPTTHAPVTPSHVGTTTRVPTPTTTSAPVTSVSSGVAPTSTAPLGTVVKHGLLNTSALENRANIRKHLHSLITNTAAALRHGILRDATRTRTIQQRIHEIINSRTDTAKALIETATSHHAAVKSGAQPITLVASSQPTPTPAPSPTPAQSSTPPVTTAAPPVAVTGAVLASSTAATSTTQPILPVSSTQPATPTQTPTLPVTTQAITLSPAVLNTINTALNAQAPQIPGLSAEDRNALVVAVVTNQITTDEAQQLINQHLREQALLNRPTVANLVNPKGTPEAAGIKGETQAPATRPKNTREVLTAAYQAENLSDTTGVNFEIALHVANVVKEQDNYFQRSLELIMNPANSMIKNFSIFSREGGPRDQQGPLSVPISG